MAVSSDPAAPLAASYRLPLAIVAVSIPVFFFQGWVGLIVALLGLFLLYQTRVIRLVFDAEALVVYRNETVLRQFPYQDWQSWAIFWAPIPTLFYFREVKSIHFLPVLFSPRELRQQLEMHLPGLEKAVAAKTVQN
ncbi:MAG: DUF3119 family protein [Cyanobacteria bacterium P01_A01_bin.114]